MSGSEAQRMLMTALISGDSEGVRNALREGAEINATDQEGRVPLTVAINSGDTSMVNLLLSLGASVVEKDDSGLSPLLVALNSSIYENTVECLDVLLQHRIALDTPLCEDRRTALMFASHASSKIVAQLLDAGADPNVVDINGWTPLHFAAAVDSCYGPEDDAVIRAELLIRAGADSSLKDKSGKTAVDIARQQCIAIDSAAAIVNIMCAK